MTNENSAWGLGALYLSFCFGDLFDYPHDCLHAFDGDMLVWSVEAVAACAEIRAGEAHEDELCSVGSSADGVAYGVDAFGFDGGTRTVEYFWSFFDDL